MFTTLFKAFLTLLSIGAVICLAIYEARTGQQINIIAYYILAGVVFGINGDQVTKILDLIKK